MKELYKLAGISKQALWASAGRNREREQKVEQVIEIIESIRENHKRMGCRKMYYVHRDLNPVGRDLFEQIGLANGYRLKRVRNIRKTTWSQRVEIYPNRIEGLVINGINQVWQSDIFYLRIQGKEHFGFVIEDVYSRKLLALNLSLSLSAKELLVALKQAIHERNGMSLIGCIFHSDRGSQFIDKDVKQLVKDHYMLGSMCLLPQENAYVERLNGTIKYEYLFEMNLTCENVKRNARIAKNLYNSQRPHNELNMMTPNAFEQYINTVMEKDRPQLVIYQWNNELLTKSLNVNTANISTNR
jgi:transposase InsO family protein